MILASRQNATRVFVVLLGASLGLATSECAQPERLSHNPNATGTAGVGAAGAAGAAGSTAGAAGDTSLAGNDGTAGQTTGVAGDTNMGLSGDNGAAGATAGTAGAGAAAGATAGSAGAAGGAAGATTGAAGAAGAAGATAGTAGAAGAAGATAGTAGAAGGAAGATAGTAGAAGGAAGATAGTAGAGGTPPAVDGCNHANWTFTAEFNCLNPPNASCGFDATQRLAQYAIDGDTTTRYTDGQTQVGGEYVVLAFNSSIKLSGVTLIANPATDGAKAYKAEYSTDGTNFVAFVPAVAGTGGLASLPINFPAATTMTALKITQTGAAVAPATSWWSINEITLNGCVDQ